MKHTAGFLDITLRVMALMLALAYGIGLLFLASGQAQAAQLNQNPTITDSVIRVGDIFGGVEDHIASHVLGPAPKPGKDMVLDAMTLNRLASALDLSWRSNNYAEQVRIRSATHMVDQQDIKDLIVDKIMSQGITQKFDIDLSDSSPEIILPLSKPNTVEIADFDYNSRHEWFTAELVSPSVSDPVTRTKVSGRVSFTTDIPVLKNSLQKGSIISAHDIKWTTVPTKAIPQDAVLRAEDIIGLTPKRMIIAEQPVQMGNLEKPQLVERGETVTIIYEDGPLTLTARGQALQGGAEKDLITVVNTTSNRSVDALIMASGTVLVQP